MSGFNQILYLCCCLVITSQIQVGEHNKTALQRQMISLLIYVVTKLALTTESFSLVTVCSSSSSSFFCSLLWSPFFGIKSSLSNPSFSQCLIPRCTASSRLLSCAFFTYFQITVEQLDEKWTLYLLKILLCLWISDMVCVVTTYSCKC